VRLVACGLLGLLAGATLAAAQDVGFSVSVSGARADYPGQRLSGIYVFNSLDVTAGPVRIWASVPLIRQWSTVDVVDPVTGTSAPARETTSGAGDPLVRIDLRLHHDPVRALQVGVAASLKPSITDAAGGLGTGASDVAFGASLFKGLGRTSILADVLYWKYGDPEGLDFEDTLSYSLGVGHVMGRGRWSSMVSLSGFSRGLEGGAAPVQLNVAALALAGRRHSLSIMAGFGLNAGASDLSFGAGWRVSLR
jgi:hypothetical protein